MRTYKHNGLSIKLSDLRAEPTQKMNGRRRVWRLAMTYHLTVTADGLTESLIIPIGFQTDFATMPLVASLLLGGRDDPGVAEAALVHDFCCVKDLPREYCNTKMWYLMLAMGVPRWKATAIYVALMLFGYKSPCARLKQWVTGWLSLET
jgi:hypothetical protein